MWVYNMPFKAIDYGGFRFAKIGFVYDSTDIVGILSKDVDHMNSMRQS